MDWTPVGQLRGELYVGLRSGNRGEVVSVSVTWTRPGVVHDGTP